MFKTVKYSLYILQVLVITALFSCDGDNAGGENTREKEITPPAISLGVITSTTIDLSWSAVDGVTGYNIYMSDSMNGTYVKLNDDPYAYINVTITGMSSNETGWFKVTALNENGESNFSNIVNGTTLLGAPALSLGAVTSSTIYLSWSSVSGAKGYNIYESYNEYVAYIKLNANPLTSLNVIITGISPNTTCYYKVTAVDNSNNESDYSNTVTGTTASDASLSAPVLAGGAVTTSTIYLSWTSVTDATGYDIYESSNQLGTYIKVNSIPLTSLNYTITGLSPNSTRYYKIKAVNSTDESDFSNIVNRTTSSGSTLSAPVLSNKGHQRDHAHPQYEGFVCSLIMLGWTSVEGASGYDVYRASSLDGTYTKLNDQPLSGLTRTVSLSKGFNYYKVKAVNGSVESDFSNTVTVSF